MSDRSKKQRGKQMYHRQWFIVYKATTMFSATTNFYETQYFVVSPQLQNTRSHAFTTKTCQHMEILWYTSALEFVMKVPTSIYHFTSKKQFCIFEYFVKGQATIAVQVSKADQVLSLQFGMVCIVWVNIHLEEMHQTETWTR